jgi:hypothetical protein
MDRRTRVLIVVVIAAAGAFVLDKVFTSLWWDPWKKLSAEIRKTDQDLAAANVILSRRDAIQKEWKTVQGHLAKPRAPDVPNHFFSHLGAMCSRVGVTTDIQGIQGGAGQQQQGDFREYVYDVKFRLTWAQFVDLLLELHNSREFLKPIRIHISSQYEREDRLDLDLKVSTIEYAPAPAKAGTR